MLSKKICRGVIPALLMSLSVGQIYAFTLFSTPVSKAINASQTAVQFAFSLGIFFLGMGAAFFGRFVEKNIRDASVIGTSLFLFGLAVADISIQIQSLPLLYIGYGLMVGLGTGIIYITPVKTLMMWFPKFKAVAAALPIIGFGLGSSLCTIIFNVLQSHGVLAENMFLHLMYAYTLPMFFGIILIRKPTRDENAILQNGQIYKATSSQDAVPYKTLFKDVFFWRCWFFMLINISAGLCIIPLAKQLMMSAHYTEAIISIVLIGMGIANGTGRFVFALWSDILRKRTNILLLISLISIVLVFAGIIPCLMGIALVLIPACYGAGFSCIPGIIHDHYGMKNVSTIHGAVLSAWGVAGLLGNQMALVADNYAGAFGVIGLIVGMHMLNLVNIRYLKRM